MLLDRLLVCQRPLFRRPDLGSAYLEQGADPEEINAPDHFYQVAAASDGLVAYWKFDEGAGKTIKDQTSYGNDLTVEKELKWVNVSLPELGK